MPEALKRLLSPEYLVVTEPGPLGGLWVLYAGLGLLFGLGLAAAGWVLAGPGRSRQPAGRRAWAWFELWVCVAGMGTVVGRFLGWPGWSARIWPYSLAVLAIAGAAAYAARRVRVPGAVVAQLRILALTWEPGGAAWPVPAAAAVLTLHAAGSGVVLAARYGWPLWTAAPAVGLLMLPAVVGGWRRSRAGASRRQAGSEAGREEGGGWRWGAMALTPLIGAYAATLLWLGYEWMGLTVIGWQGLAFPNPMTSAFYVDGVVLAATSWTVLAETRVGLQLAGRGKDWWRAAAAAVLVATAVWAGGVYFGKRTHGATASDPYAYAQMGVDLAERGTFLHRFGLFQTVMPLDIAWAPLQPVGYHIPRNELGDCPSVWPTGAAVLLAAGYGLAGEAGLYVTTPLVALAALAATWLLVQEVLRDEGKAVRAVTGALTVALAASSPEFVDRLLVPMADAAAQLFTVLMLWLLLRATRSLTVSPRQAVGWMAAAGVAFGWAYWVRHTQLVLAPAAVVAVLVARTSERRSRWQKVGLVALFGGAALVAATPDIVYRWRTFGGILATESSELPSMGVQYAAAMAWQMLREALVAGEWGYLFPLALFGGYRLARRQPRQAAVLGVALAAVVAVHLSYRFLRLRDLISVFPLAHLAAAYGAVEVVRRARALAGEGGQAKRLGRLLLPVGAVAFAVASLAMARWAMIDNLGKPGWASFGYMRPDQRAAFDRLAELTPADAAVGASLNAGAVALYSGRDPIRPYDTWTEEEWGTFLEAMRSEGRPVYLLDDGGLMEEWIREQAGRRRLTPVEELSVPIFYAPGRESGWLYRLESEP